MNGQRARRVKLGICKLGLYPALFVLAWVPGLVHRLMEAGGLPIPFGLFIVHSFCGSR